ncbi:MAG TPA: type II toxin-antitoxin system RelE/ParE family toxin [Mucilaginibacter sp.]|nr:type II toxin-antitoxin system RelE/ParE family toxin [Mucilaginibacter sp.]
MADLLIWSERATEEFNKLQDYLISEWGEDISRRVLAEISQTLIRIQNSPEHFPYVKEQKKIRLCVASPQTSIYFQELKDAVVIVSVFDNRQNPRKLKL